MLDRSIIGREFPTVSVTVELDAVRRFARAIGDTQPGLL